MDNAQIAACFSEMALLLELAGENPFRIRAYRRAAQTLSGLPQPLASVTQEELLEIPGIGKGIAAHIRELLAQGSLAELKALRQRVPKGLLDMVQVQGVGPKRAKLLFDKLKISSLEGLRQAALAGKLRGLTGFGAKSEENVLQAVAFTQASGQRALYWDAKRVMDDLTASMKGCPGLERLEPAGSLRRGKETVGDLDLLCSARDEAAAIGFFTHLPQVERVMAAGKTKATVLLKNRLQCDLRAVKPACFGAALQYFTGSKEHNVALRELARKKGYLLNEYGLFRSSDLKRRKPLAGETEAGIYEKLGLSWIEPELREASGEIEAAQEGTLPELVTLKDIRGDFHNHTLYSDGEHSMAAMAAAAAKMGWEWVALGDHSQGLKIARGMPVDMLRKTIEELRRLQRQDPGVRLLRSMEVEILKDGGIDYPDSVLEAIDVVIASVHSSFKQSEADMTRRVLRAMDNPHVDIIGHLSGRLLGRREPTRVDAQAVLEAAARCGVALEINGQPERLDLRDIHARRARELGVALACATDAHAADQFSYMRLAVLVARRAWLTRKDLLNCLGYDELQDWLSRHRRRASR